MEIRRIQNLFTPKLHANLFIAVILFLSQVMAEPLKCTALFNDEYSVSSLPALGGIDRSRWPYTKLKPANEPASDSDTPLKTQIKELIEKITKGNPKEIIFNQSKLTDILLERLESRGFKIAFHATDSIGIASGPPETRINQVIQNLKRKGVRVTVSVKPLLFYAAGTHKKIDYDSWSEHEIELDYTFALADSEQTMNIIFLHEISHFHYQNSLARKIDLPYYGTFVGNPIYDRAGDFVEYASTLPFTEHYRNSFRLEENAIYLKNLKQERAGVPSVASIPVFDETMPKMKDGLDAKIHNAKMSAGALRYLIQQVENPDFAQQIRYGLSHTHPSSGLKSNQKPSRSEIVTAQVPLKVKPEDEQFGYFKVSLVKADPNDSPEILLVYLKEFLRKAHDQAVEDMLEFQKMSDESP